MTGKKKLIVDSGLVTDLGFSDSIEDTFRFVNGKYYEHDFIDEEFDPRLRISHLDELQLDSQTIINLAEARVEGNRRTSGKRKGKSVEYASSPKKHKQQGSYSIEFEEPSYNKGIPFLEQIQDFSIRGKSVSEVKSFYKSVLELQISTSEEFKFEDHVFEIDIPYTEKEIEKVANTSGLRMKYAKIEPIYNFYIQGYEDLISGGHIPENVLPNMYVLLSEARGYESNNEFSTAMDKFFPTNPHFFNLVTLGGALPRNIIRPSIIKKANGSSPHAKKYSGGQYYDLWSKNYNTAKKATIDKLKTRYSNLFITHEEIKLIKDFNGYHELFPMHVAIEFIPDKNSAFSEILEKCFIAPSFMYTMAQRSNAFCEKKFNKKEKIEGIVKGISKRISKSFVTFPERVDIKRIGNLNLAEKKVTKVREELFFSDVTDWWENLQSSFHKEGGSDSTQESKIKEDSDLFSLKEKSVFLGSEDQKAILGLDPQNDFLGNLGLIIFLGKMRNLIKNKLRTFEDVFNGEKAYSEAIFYKISKFLVSQGPNGESVSKKPIQRIFLPNADELSVIKFIDTQVKYGKDQKYRYEINAFHLVIGNKYRYKLLDHSLDDSTERPFFKYRVFSRPSIKIIETNFFAKNLGVYDDPPTPPNVDIVPYRGISNKILMNFNNNVGEYILNPVIIEPQDSILIFKLRKNKELEKDEPLLYKSDDHTGFFEIFRTEKKPLSYKDFADKRKIILMSDISKETIQSATAASFVDEIKPNKKYYYTFRMIDIHDNISNPTPIYELEMVDENGSIYPILKIVDLEKAARKSSIPMKKFVQIVPKFEHEIINKSKSKLPDIEEPLGNYDLEKIRLGLKEESIWNKKFKIRFTSKKTGKKIDLNLQFKTKQDKNFDI